MCEGRGRAEWGRTSSIMALLANIWRDRARRPTPFHPADFSPYGGSGTARGVPLTRDVLHELADTVSGKDREKES